MTITARYAGRCSKCGGPIRPATPNDLMMAADCEQCAAIALAFLDRSN